MTNETNDDTSKIDQEFSTTDTMVFRIPRPKTRPVSDPMWHIRVEVVGGPMDGTRARVDGDSFAIGRGTENDLKLAKDPGVSTRHARIVRDGRSYWLEDLESRNGTFIGDQRLTDRMLISVGATFTCGQTQLELMPR